MTPPPTFKRLQGFRDSILPREHPPSIYIEAYLDRETQQYVLLWEEIRLVFKLARHVRNGSSRLKFLQDRNGKRLLPLRIQYQHHVILDVFSEHDDKEVGSDSDGEPISLLRIAMIEDNLCSDSTSDDDCNSDNESTPSPWIALTKNASEVETISDSDIDFDSNFCRLQKKPTVLKAPVAHQADRVEEDLGSYQDDDGDLSAKPTSSTIDGNQNFLTLDRGLMQKWILETLRLLHTYGTGVQYRRDVVLYLADMLVHENNTVAFVDLGGLNIITQLVDFPDIIVRDYLSLCILNLTLPDTIALKVAQSELVSCMMDMVKSGDNVVRFRATAALYNLTFSEDSMQEMVSSETIQFFVEMLSMNDTDVQYHCLAALFNITSDSSRLIMLACSGQELVWALISFLGSYRQNNAYIAARTLHHLAIFETFQTLIVASQGLPSLLRMSFSVPESMILASIQCVSRLAMLPLNGLEIIDSGFMERLTTLLSYNLNQKIRAMALLTLNRLTVNEELIPILLEKNLYECMLNQSRNPDIAQDCLMVIKNLVTGTEDYEPFISTWKDPDGGLHDCLLRSLDSQDRELQCHATNILKAFLDDEDVVWSVLIELSDAIMIAVRGLANTPDTYAPYIPQHEETKKSNVFVATTARHILRLLEHR